jgi:hypothetical protein
MRIYTVKPIADDLSVPNVTRKYFTYGLAFGNLSAILTITITNRLALARSACARPFHPTNMSTPVNEQNMAEVVQEHATPLFRPPCTDCGFCDGLRDMDCEEKDGALGAIRLEQEDDYDGLNVSETRPKTMKGKR